MADPRSEDLVGWQVRVTTTDERVLVFRVIEVTEDTLVGEFQRARFDEVAAVERREYYAGETAGTLAMILGALALLVGLLYAPGAG
jgi:hypothetical protein